MLCCNKTDNASRMATTFPRANSPVRSRRKLPKNLGSLLELRSVAALSTHMLAGLVQSVQKSSFRIMSLTQATQQATNHKLLHVSRQSLEPVHASWQCLRFRPPPTVPGA